MATSRLIGFSKTVPASTGSYVFRSRLRAKTNWLKSASGLGVRWLVNCVATSAGIKGVELAVGVSETEGVFEIVGVRVMLGMGEMVGVGVIDGVGLGVTDGG